MKKLSIILFCLFLGCLSAQERKEFEHYKQVRDAEKAGRVVAEINEGDPFIRLLWKDPDGKVLKAGRIPFPWILNEL